MLIATARLLNLSPFGNALALAAFLVDGRIGIVSSKGLGRGFESRSVFLLSITKHTS